MMVPANRLLAAAAVVFFGCALLCAIRPGVESVAGLALVVFLLVAAIDVWISRFRIASVSVQVNPEPVRTTKGISAGIPFQLQGHLTRALPLKMAVPLPFGLEGPVETLQTTLPADGMGISLSWPCQPERRGEYVLQWIYLEAASRLGLWRMREQRPFPATVRVFPNIRTEQSRVAAVFLNRNPVGLHSQRQVGRGREFEQLREYVAGDALEDIHWKATARRAHPISKVYRIERTQEVYVVLDASRFSERVLPDGSGTHLELGISAALVLAMVAERQGDRFGLVAFSDRMDRFVRAGQGKAHYQSCRNAVYTLQSKVVNPDFAEIFTELRLRLRRRALLVFLTHLDDPIFSEAFAQHVRVLSKLHLVVVFVMTPEGVQPLFSSPAASVDEIYEHLAGHLQWHDLSEVQRQLRRNGVTMRMTSRSQLTPDLVNQYMYVKKRQLI